jgi:aspartate oxidase
MHKEALEALKRVQMDGLRLMPLREDEAMRKDIEIIRTSLEQAHQERYAVKELSEALEYVSQACLCDRYTARREHKGFDYGQDHPRMGKAKSGSRWVTPSHRAYECLDRNLEAIKRVDDE